AQGNTVTTATTSITVAIGTNPASGTLAGAKTVAAVSGVATFSSLSLNTAGTGYKLAGASTGLRGDARSPADARGREAQNPVGNEARLPRAAEHGGGRCGDQARGGGGRPGCAGQHGDDRHHQHHGGDRDEPREWHPRGG